MEKEYERAAATLEAVIELIDEVCELSETVLPLDPARIDRMRMLQEQLKEWRR
jgi:hypothetical protein